jgi:hypothetical protein
MKLNATAAVVILLTFIIACHNKTENQNLKAENEIIQNAITDNKSKYQTEGNGFTTDSTALPGTDKVEDKVDQKKQPVQQKEPAPTPDWDKIIIKTASLNLEVKEYQSFYTALREKVRTLGGYVAQEEQQQDEYKVENTLIIKVPVNQFDNALSQFALGVLQVNEKKVTSEDVTAQYIDTRSRIEAKRQVRNRYMDLLKQARNMEEILSVQSEINSIHEEIESATGRAEYLFHSAAYSTINLTFYQVLDASAKTGEIGNTFGTKLLNAFKAGGRWFGILFIELVSIWPLYIFLLAGMILYKRYRPKIVK